VKRLLDHIRVARVTAGQPRSRGRHELVALLLQQAVHLAPDGPAVHDRRGTGRAGCQSGRKDERQGQQDDTTSHDMTMSASECTVNVMVRARRRRRRRRSSWPDRAAPLGAA
jgi:hypothetical protein